MVENTVRSIPARKNWQEKGEYGKLFTRISGQNTSGVGREGKFALESCGYEPCATAYHRTLSSPPVESTVTRCTTWIPPSMATTEIHGVDAVSRLLVRPRVARTKEEYGIRGGISQEEEDGGRRGTNPWERGVYKLYPRLLRPRERFRRNFHLEHVGSLLVLGRPSLESVWFSRIYAKWIVWSRGRE